MEFWEEGMEDWYCQSLVNLGLLGGVITDLTPLEEAELIAEECPF